MTAASNCNCLRIPLEAYINSSAMCANRAFFVLMNARFVVCQTAAESLPDSNV